MCTYKSLIRVIIIIQRSVIFSNTYFFHWAITIAAYYILYEWVADVIYARIWEFAQCYGRGDYLRTHFLHTQYPFGVITPPGSMDVFSALKKKTHKSTSEKKNNEFVYKKTNAKDALKKKKKINF